MNKLILICTLAFAAPLAFGMESAGERAEAKAHNAHRSMKKSGHRISEALCAKGDAKCLGEKAKHRGQEGSDFVKDKAEQGKNKVD